jgi:hypothetical protein
MGAVAGAMTDQFRAPLWLLSGLLFRLLKAGLRRDQRPLKLFLSITGIFLAGLWLSDPPAPGRGCARSHLTGVGHGTHRYQVFENRQERLYRDGGRSTNLECITIRLDRRTVSLPAVQRDAPMDEEGRADRRRVAEQGERSLD